MNPYRPASDFLNLILTDKVAIDQSVYGQQNLRRLLSFVSDEDRTNRDWAAHLISGLAMDTSPIRQALETAARDPDRDTRDEAIVGLARRDRKSAIEHLVPLLENEVSIVLLEAAAILGEADLVPLLKRLKQDGAITQRMQKNWKAAFNACKVGVSSEANVSPSELERQHRIAD